MKEKTYYRVLIILLSMVLIIGLGFDLGVKYWLGGIAVLVTYVWCKKDFTDKKWFGKSQKEQNKSFPPVIDEEDLPYISEQGKNGYISLAKLCVSPDTQGELIAFVEDLKDYSQHNHMTTLHCVAEYSDNHDLFFIMALDWKQDIETLEWRLEKALQDNFGISVELPNALDYGEEVTVSDDPIFGHYDQPLRAKGFQIGFIDEDSDEHVILVHKVNDKDKIEKAVNSIGYRYYEVGTAPLAEVR